MPDHERDELDGVLDSALASYAAEDPRPGLETRVLARVRRRRFGRAVWAAAIPVAAGLCFWAVTLRSGLDEAIRPPAVPAPVIARAPAPPVLVKRAPPRRRPPLPKREQFPSPSPLTEEERILAGFVRRSPEEALERMSEAKSQTLEPIKIEAIQIEPLQKGG